MDRDVLAKVYTGYFIGIVIALVVAYTATTLAAAWVGLVLVFAHFVGGGIVLVRSPAWGEAFKARAYSAGIVGDFVLLAAAGLLIWGIVRTDRSAIVPGLWIALVGNIICIGSQLYARCKPKPATGINAVLFRA